MTIDNLTNLTLVLEEQDKLGEGEVWKTKSVSASPSQASTPNWVSCPPCPPSPTWPWCPPPPSRKTAWPCLPCPPWPPWSSPLALRQVPSIPRPPRHLGAETLDGNYSPSTPHYRNPLHHISLQVQEFTFSLSLGFRCEATALSFSSTANLVWK